MHEEDDYPEKDERGRRSLERHIRDAHLGSFKPLCGFVWAWPKRCDRAAVEELMALEFVKDISNVVLIWPNGVSKSTLALNFAYQAIVRGHIALFTTAGQMLVELAALDSDSALRRETFHFCDYPYRVFYAAIVVILLVGSALSAQYHVPVNTFVDLRIVTRLVARSKLSPRA